MQVGKGSAVGNAIMHYTTPSHSAETAEQKGTGKLTGLGVLLHKSQCCNASLAHAHPTMFYIPLVSTSDGRTSCVVVMVALVNPRRTCAARVTVLGLCVCYSTSHFSRLYSCHKRY